MPRLLVPILALAAFAPVTLPAAAVHKCRSVDGAVTYQQLPCAGSQQGESTDIPSEYPPPNLAERERLLQREAEMYRRLEAQRDRLSAEAITRRSSPQEVVLVVQERAVTGFVHAFPPWRPRAHPRNAFREWSRGRLR